MPRNSTSKHGEHPNSLSARATHDPELRRLLKEGERRSREDKNAMERFAHQQDPRERQS